MYDWHLFRNFDEMAVEYKPEDNTSKVIDTLVTIVL
jgi:hypothetical protein